MAISMHEKAMRKKLQDSSVQNLMRLIAGEYVEIKTAKAMFDTAVELIPDCNQKMSVKQKIENISLAVGIGNLTISKDDDGKWLVRYFDGDESIECSRIIDSV